MQSNEESNKSPTYSSTMNHDPMVLPSASLLQQVTISPSTTKSQLHLHTNHVLSVHSSWSQRSRYTLSNQAPLSNDTDRSYSRKEMSHGRNKMSLQNLLSTENHQNTIGIVQQDLTRKHRPGDTSTIPINSRVRSKSSSPSRSTSKPLSSLKPNHSLPEKNNVGGLSSNTMCGNSLIDLLNEGIIPQLNLNPVNTASSDYLDRHPLHRAGRLNSTSATLQHSSAIPQMGNFNLYSMKQNSLVQDEVAPICPSNMIPKISYVSGMSTVEPKTKRPWTKQEDALLRALVEQLGQGLWAAIAAQIPGRTGKQVRERWLNHLSPNVTKRPWSVEEDEIIIESHSRFGNSWSRIAKLLEGRSDNSVKNRFYTTLKRKIAPQRNSNKRGSPVSSSQGSQKKKTRTSGQPPSEQVELVDQRYAQTRSWK